MKFLEEWTSLMYRSLTLEFDFFLAFTRSLSISSYYFMTLGDGGDLCSFSSDLSLGRRLYCPVMCLSFDIYFCWTYGWCRQSLCAEGVLERRVLSPRAFDRLSLTQISLWSDLRH